MGDVALYTTTEKIKAVLENIRPMIQRDGGDICFVSFERGIVTIRLQGACVGCPIAQYTVKFGIEEALREQVPEVIEVISIDDEQ